MIRVSLVGLDPHQTHPDAMPRQRGARAVDPGWSHLGEARLPSLPDPEGPSCGLVVRRGQAAGLNPASRAGSAEAGELLAAATGRLAARSRATARRWRRVAGRLPAPASKRRRNSPASGQKPIPAGRPATGPRAHPAEPPMSGPPIPPARIAQGGGGSGPGVIAVCGGRARDVGASIRCHCPDCRVAAEPLRQAWHDWRSG